MKPTYLLVMSALLICGCGPEKNPYAPPSGIYGQISNDREFGVIVSVNQSETPAARNADKAAGVVTGSSSDSGMLSFLGNSITSISSSNTETISKLHYIIRKDNGQQIAIDQVPDAGEAILYPGQKVMIQANGNYLRVYPADVEERLRQQ